MTQVEVCVAERLAAWNRRSASSRFAAFVEDSKAAGWDDDTWADMIRVDVQQRSSLRLPVRMQEYTSVPEIVASPVLIDTAICAVVSARIAAGRTRAEAFAEIRAECPDLSSEIATAEMLSSLLGSGSAVSAQRTSLPKRLGPPSVDGRPRYELLHRIASGAHATVYRAIDHELCNDERPAWVAVKLLWPRTDPSARRRLLAEAERARHVAHPNVIPIYDAGCSHDGEIFIVTPVYEARTLADAFVEPSTQNARLLVEMIRQVCAGLQAVHGAGMLHCDIKPLNILMDSGGGARIADFGLSLWMEQDDDAEPRGTLGFMAPEQRSQARDWRRPCVDTYATGATLIWGLTGKVLHGESRSEAEDALADQSVHAAMVEQRLAPVSDPELRLILARSVSHDPRQRYQTAESFGSDLNAWLSGEPLEWMHLGAARRFALWRRRAPAQFLGVMSLVLAVFALVVAGVWAVNRSYAMKIERANEIASSSQRELTSARSMLASSIKMLGIARDSRWRDSSTPSLTIIEAVYGPRFFDESGLLRVPWEARLDEARRNQVGLPVDSVEYLHWRVLEGIWLMQDERFAEAYVVLTDAAKGWAERCKPGDAWLLDVESLLSAARVLTVSSQRLAARRNRTEPQDLTPLEIDALDRSLRRVVEDPRPTRRIYYLAARALLALEDTSWRDNPARTSEILADVARRRQASVQ